MPETGRLRARLLLLAIDSDTQDEVAECIDEWDAAGLISNTFLLNVGNSGEEFAAAFAGDPTWRTLDAVLNHLPWHEITVISVRTWAIGATTQERVGKEEALVERLRKAYPPTSEVQPRLFTLSLFVPTVEFRSAHLPRRYPVHLIHESTNFVDERLPRQPLGRDVASTLAFTAVVAGGGLSAQRETPLSSLNDHSLDNIPRLRFVRAMGRAATAGFLLDKSIRRIIGPGSATSLVETPGISVIDDDPKLLTELSAEVTNAARLRYQRRDEKPTDSPIEETGFFKAISRFFTGFGHYLGKAVETTIKTRIEDRARTFLDAFQELLFGDDSTIRIKGTTTTLSPEHALEELARRSAEFKEIEKFGRLESRPTPTPSTWRLLTGAALAALDGNSSAEATRCLQKGGVRTVFRRPSVLGPAPVASDFPIAGETLARTGLDSRFALVDALDFGTHAALETALREARLDTVFSGESAGASTPTETSRSRVRISTSREERIADRKEASTTTTPAVPTETVTELRRRFETWRARCKSEYSGTLLWQISASVHEGMRAAKDDYKFDEIKKLYEESSALLPPAHKSVRKLLSIVGLSTIALFAFGFVLSRIGVASLIGLPIALLFFIIWLFGISLTLGKSIIRHAIELRKFDLACKKSDSDLSRLIRLTLNAVREYGRLLFIERQLTEWSRAIREVAHAPFGRLTDVDDASDRLPTVPRPPQFAIGRFHSRPDQISAIDREVWVRILRIGYLSDLFRALRAKWEDEYNMYAPGGLEPESDTGPSRVIGPAARRPSGHIMNPRSDLTESLLRYDLRASATESELATIARWFSDHHIGDLFSSLDHVDTAHHAFDKFSPEDFLLNLVSARRSVDFDPNSFTPEVDARVDNVESQSRWVGDASLGSYSITPDKPLHFVTWALDLGHLHPYGNLVGGNTSATPPGDALTPRRVRS